MHNFFDLPSFDQVNILVFGDVMLDSYWTGGADRVSPEAPVPIVKMQQRNTRPGGAANVALNLATLGCQVSLFGVVGNDEEARELTEQLTEKGIECHFYSEPNFRTIRKIRVISRQQQMLRLDFESSFKGFDDRELLAQYQEQLKKANLIIFSDYGKGTLYRVAEYIRLAKERALPVFVDPKGNDYSIYHGATLITPNLLEFETIVGSCNQQDEFLISKAKALIRANDFSAILVTRGKDGMSLVFADDRKTLHLKAHAREVFDVTGAGDTAIALMSASVAIGIDYEHSAYLANLAAGLVVRKLGTAFVTIAELRDALRAEHGFAHGVVSEEQLLSIVQDAKAKGEKIVMTNGCFDIIHPGHIQYLNQAKALGDRLIVAVNNDDSVSRLKGEARPINPLDVRMEVLSALRSVDWVVSFSEDTPARLISEILPDVLVKGGDYEVQQIAGHEVVLANGGEVLTLPFRKGHSTTSLVEKLKER